MRVHIKIDISLFDVDMVVVVFVQLVVAEIDQTVCIAVLYPIGNKTRDDANALLLSVWTKVIKWVVGNTTKVILTVVCVNFTFATLYPNPIAPLFVVAISALVVNCKGWFVRFGKSCYFFFTTVLANAICKLVSVSFAIVFFACDK